MKTVTSIRLENLKLLRSEVGSAKGLSEKTGKSPSLLSRLFSGNKTLGDKMARDIEQSMDLPVGWLDNARAIMSAQGHSLDTTLPLIPLLSLEQSLLWDGDVTKLKHEEPLEWLTHPQAGGHKLFAIKINGDTMTNISGGVPSFRHGQVIFVEPENKEVKHGACVVAAPKDAEEAVFLRIDDSGIAPVLKPINSQYDFTVKNFEVLGTVVASTTYYKY